MIVSYQLVLLYPSHGLRFRELSALVLRSSIRMFQQHACAKHMCKTYVHTRLAGSNTKLQLSQSVLPY